jgi:hypothetical protein
MITTNATKYLAKNLILSQIIRDILVKKHSKLIIKKSRLSVISKNAIKSLLKVLI